MFMFSRNRFGCTPFCCSLPWGGGRDVRVACFYLSGTWPSYHN